MMMAELPTDEWKTVEWTAVAWPTVEWKATEWTTPARPWRILTSAPCWPRSTPWARWTRSWPAWSLASTLDARAQALFTALYGASEAAVRANCEAVRFDGKAVAFNVRHGAAQALMRVWGRIAALLPRHPEWGAVLRPLGGTLAWRRIAGTTRLSMHSFGIALDLNPHLPYWRTFPGEEGDLEAITRRRSGFPPEILAAFEAEGFIWGGKWASFDLMHFEYRPEMLLKARVLAGQVSLP